MELLINLIWLGVIISVALFLAQFVFAFIAMIFILPIVGINALVQKFKK